MLESIIIASVILVVGVIALLIIIPPHVRSILDKLVEELSANDSNGRSGNK